MCLYRCVCGQWSTVNLNTKGTQESRQTHTCTHDGQVRGVSEPAGPELTSYGRRPHTLPCCSLTPGKSPAAPPARLRLLPMAPGCHTSAISCSCVRWPQPLPCRTFVTSTQDACGSTCRIWRASCALMPLAALLAVLAASCATPVLWASAGTHACGEKTHDTKQQCTE